MYSQDLPKKSTSIPAVIQRDSLNITIKSKEIVKDTIKKDSIKNTSGLDGQIKRKAVQYEKINQKKKQITLYDKAEVYYKDIELKSGIIIIDYEKEEVYAGRIKDSAGVYTQYPYFKQGANIVEPDSIRFNFKTKKALIWNARTDQGEFRLKGEITKRENDSVYFVKNAKFTTSKNLDDPEYYFLARKIKLVPKSKIVTGLTNMVIANVPTPLGVPFAFFPMTEESTSGVIIPTFGDSNAQGYFLQNGGYYFALNKHYDLTLLGDYYTNGTYAFRAETTYANIYKFRGNFNFRYENQITGERGLPGYARSNLYNIQWSHAPDAKATPNSRFSASVNLGSQKYFQNSLNQVNSAATINNTLQSSVSYSKTFNTIPQSNISLTASHSQNTNTGEINMTLPTLQGSIDRIFPFAPKDGTKKGFIKNINFQYNIRGENRILTTDSLFFKPQMFRDAKNGLQHSIPLTTNFKVLKYFSISTGANYRETWYLKTINKKFNTITNKNEDIDVNGFARFGAYDFNANIGTTIYGTFKFKKGKRIQAIRHVMNPGISYSNLPSSSGYFKNYIVDAAGTLGQFTCFDGGIFGAPTNTTASNLGFSLTNSFEAKVTDRDSTKVEPKKVMLLSNLSFNTSYNLKATDKQQKWSPVSMSGGTVFFDNKMDVNFSATLNPYAVNTLSQPVNIFNIDNGGSLFRLTQASINIGYSLDSKGKKDNKTESGIDNQGLRNGGRTDDLFGATTDFSDRRTSQFEKNDEEESKFEGFFNAKIPWDLKLVYVISYTNVNRERKIDNSSLMFSGNIEISPKWKAGVSSGYDFVQKGVTRSQLRFERDLLSWRADFDWIPFGPNPSWYFFIGISSSVLSDIKWDKRNVPDRRQ